MVPSPNIFGIYGLILYRNVKQKTLPIYLFYSDMLSLTRIFLCPATKSGEGYYVIPSEILSVRPSVSASIIRVRSITLISSEIFSQNFTQM